MKKFFNVGNKTISIVYDRRKFWVAQMYDFDGKIIGMPQYCSTKEEAIFALAALYGARPEQFARPLSEIAD